MDNSQIIIVLNQLSETLSNYSNIKKAFEYQSRKVKAKKEIDDLQAQINILQTTPVEDKQYVKVVSQPSSLTKKNDQIDSINRARTIKAIVMRVLAVAWGCIACILIISGWWEKGIANTLISLGLIFSGLLGVPFLWLCAKRTQRPKVTEEQAENIENALDKTEIGKLQRKIERLRAELDPRLYILLPHPIKKIFEDSHIHDDDEMYVYLEDKLRSIVENITTLNKQLPLAIDENDLLTTIQPEIILKSIINELHSNNADFETAYEKGLEKAKNASEDINWLHAVASTTAFQRPTYSNNNSYESSNYESKSYERNNYEQRIQEERRRQEFERQKKHEEYREYQNRLREQREKDIEHRAQLHKEAKERKDAMRAANHQCNSCARRVGCTVVGRPNCASYVPKHY